MSSPSSKWLRFPAVVGLASVVSAAVMVVAAAPAAARSASDLGLLSATHEMPLASPVITLGGSTAAAKAARAKRSMDHLAAQAGQSAPESSPELPIRPQVITTATIASGVGLFGTLRRANSGGWIALSAKYSANSTYSILRSSDGGVNWTGVSVPGAVSTGVPRFTIADDGTVFVVTFTTNVTSLWILGPSSSTWTTGGTQTCSAGKTTDPDIAYGSSAVVIVSPKGCVQKSTNGGTSITNIATLMMTQTKVFVSNSVVHITGKLTTSGQPCYSGVNYTNWFGDYSRLSLTTGAALTPSQLPVVGCQHRVMGLTSDGYIYLASEASYSDWQDGLELAVSANDGSYWSNVARAEPLPDELGIGEIAVGIASSGEFEIYSAVVSGSTTRLVRVQRTFNGSAAFPGSAAAIGEAVTDTSEATLGSALTGIQLFPPTRPAQTTGLLGVRLAGGVLTRVGATFSPVADFEIVPVVANADGTLPFSTVATVSSSPSGNWTTFLGAYPGTGIWRVFLANAAGYVFDIGLRPSGNAVPLVDDEGGVSMLATEPNPNNALCIQARGMQYWLAADGWYGPTFAGWGCANTVYASVDTEITANSVPVSFVSLFSRGSGGIKLLESPGRDWVIGSPLAAIGATSGLALGDYFYTVSGASLERWDMRTLTATTSTLPAAGRLVTSPSDPSALYLVYLNATVMSVWRSTDHATTWTSIISGLAKPSGMSATLSRFVIDANGLLETYSVQACSSQLFVSRWELPLVTGSSWAPGETLWTAPGTSGSILDPAYRSAEVGGEYQNIFVDVGSTVVALPVDTAAGSGAFGLNDYAAMSGAINVVAGGLSRTEIDATVTTASLPLQVSRSYNSGDSRIGLFGTGWSSSLEMRATTNCSTNGVTITYPDGRTEDHRLAGSTYVGPSGYGSRLTKPNSTTYLLTQADGMVYDFEVSTGRLRSITDPAGRAQTITYNGSGKPTTLTDALSARSFTFTYTGNKVTQVSSSSVTVNGTTTNLVWRYGYVGDALERVCASTDPNLVTGDCTLYTTIAGRLTTIIDPNGHNVLEVGYDASGRVAWQDDPLDNRTTFSRPSARVSVTTDPALNSTTYTFDGNFRIARIDDALGGVQTFEYDSAGYRSQLVDANGDTIGRTFDTRGRVLSETNGEGETQWFSYDSAGNVTGERDGRSSGATDPTHLIESTWNTTYRLLLSRRLPTQPSATTYSYTTGTESAVGGGTMPARLLRTITTAGALVTTMSYDNKGNLRTTVEPSGLTKNLVYDELGRLLSSTEVSDSYPSGLTTSFVYDAMGRVTRVTFPAVTNVVSGVTHRQQVDSIYDSVGNLLQVTSTDISGGVDADDPRQTTYTYDDANRMLDQSTVGAGTTSYEYDAMGNLTATVDPLGRETRTTYDDLNRSIAESQVANATYGPTVDTVMKTIEYDAAGHQTAIVDALGRRTESTYDSAGRVLTRTLIGYNEPGGGTHNVVLDEYIYDDAGLIASEEHGNGLVHIDVIHDASGRMTGRTVDPADRNVLTTITYDDDGRVLSTVEAAAGATLEHRYQYDAAGRRIREVTENGTTDLTSAFTYDQRGLVTAETDPRGMASGATPADFTTEFSYDELGRRSVTIAPEIPVSADGTTPVTAQPTTELGYNTFGDVTHQRNARGDVTTAAFDQLGRKVQEERPSTLTSTSTTVTSIDSWSYDDAGNVIETVDPVGAITNFTYDFGNRALTWLQPTIGASRPTTTWTYDLNGNVLTQTDAVGAAVEHTYDDLDRLRTTTTVVRTGPSTTDEFTEHIANDDLGRAVSRTTPEGELWTTAYSALGEVNSVVTPGSATTVYEYDLPGRETAVIDPLGRQATTEYDLAGRPVAQSTVSSSSAVLGTSTVAYDEAGNVVSRTPARGNAATTPSDYTTAYEYDALSRLSSIDEPRPAGSVTTAQYRYNAMGQPTAVINASLNVTTYQYNERGEQIGSVEPSTAQHSSLGDRSWVSDYDGRGLLVQEQQPGGITVVHDYDDLGRRVSSVATDGTATMSKAYDYDAMGRLTTADSGGATLTLTYEDRGLPASASGASSTATWEYDGDGRMIEKVDSVGTTLYSWNAQSQLETVTAPGAAGPIEYAYNSAGQMESVALPGTGVRTFGYDDYGRLESDELSDGTSVTSLTEYDRDEDGNVVGEVISGSGRAGVGSQAYEYDVAGRLVEWTPQSGPAVTYSWDDAGNLIDRGGITATYDERNRLAATSDGWSYAYSARGDATSRTDGSVTVSSEFDLFGRLVDTGTSSVTYDALDRPLSVGSDALSYAGMAAEPSMHGSEDFVRDPNGKLIGTNGGSAWTWWSSDAHGDATVAIDDDGALVGSVEFDPFGVRSSSVGLTSSVGLQGDLTDAGSGAVWMGARWFDPTRAGFVSRDSFAGRPSEPGSLNRYAYAEGNPLSRWDPSGYEAEPRDDGSTKALVWSNAPTTTWAPVGPPPPKTGWSFSRFKQGASDAITSPVRLVYRATTDLLECGFGAEGHGCFETVKQVGRGLVMMAKNPTAFIEECMNDVSYCAGGVLGGAILTAAPKILTTVLKYASEVSKAARLLDELDEIGGAAKVATNSVEGVDLSLKYKPGWSADQVAAADGKVASLNQAAQNGELSLASVERSGTSAASRYRAAGNSVPTGADVDHVIDLQLGGADAITNMSPLNASVNRSLGAQIACQLSGMPVGTAIRSVSIC